MIRKLMWFALGFAAACVLGSYCFTPWLVAAAGVAVLFSLSGLLWKKNKVVMVVGTLCFGLAVGVGWFFAYDQLYLDNARSVDNTTQDLVVEASDYSYETDYGSAVEGQTVLDGKRYRILLYREGMESLKPGDRIRCSVNFRFTTRGGVEEPTYHRGNGVFLLAYSQGSEEITYANKTPTKYLPAVLRRDLLQRIDEHFSSDTAYFAKGLLLGNRTEMDYETSTAFKVSGILHIIAVSGLHISILFAVVYLITARQRFLTALIGIPAVIIFTAVAGFTPSITRACIMQILMMLALLLDQEYDPGTALAFSALVMLGVNPLVITSVSFQLSVGCMAGIFLFSQRVNEWVVGLRPWRTWKSKTKRGRFIRWMARSLSITISAMFFTTPLVALYFGSVSLIGVVTNILVLWIVTVIFYGIMAVCLISLFWSGAAHGLGWLFDWLIRYVLLTAKTLASFPLAAVYTKSIYIVIWLVLCYSLVILFLIMKRHQPLVLTCCSLIGLSVALICSWVEPLLDDTRMTVLNVGQGQSLILQSDGKTILIDCGGDSDTASADLAAETLLSQGITRLDAVIVTHYDQDHAGGVGYLLSRVPADVVLLPTAPDTEGTLEGILEYSDGSEYFVDSDQLMRWNDNELTVFGPLIDGDDNESGLCVLFENENCDILVTGDISSTTEYLLTIHTDLPKLTALMVGHHGSKYSTGEKLLQATKPDYAFISVGENSYGHPTQEVLERLMEIGCQVFRTDQYGTIIFRR